MGFVWFFAFIMLVYIWPTSNVAIPHVADCIDGCANCACYIYNYTYNII